MGRPVVPFRPTPPLQLGSVHDRAMPRRSMSLAASGAESRLPEDRPQGLDVSRQDAE